MPPFATVAKHDKFATITIAREPVNSMNCAVWKELAAAVSSVEDDPKMQAVIFFSGLTRNIFTAGNDLMELYAPATNLEKYTDFWVTQNKFLADLYSSRLVTIAAIRGACPAGGCITSLVCDYRIFLEDEGLGAAHIGLNEPAIGIPVPKYWMQILIKTIGHRQAEWLGCNGKLVPPKEALRLGLVDELVPMEKGRDGLTQAALDAVKRLLKIPPQGRAITKMSVRAEFSDVWGDQQRLKDEAEGGWGMLSSPPVVAAMKATLDRMSKKPKL